MKSSVALWLYASSFVFSAETNPFLLPDTAPEASSEGSARHHLWRKFEIKDQALLEQWRDGEIIPTPKVFQQYLKDGKIQVTGMWAARGFEGKELNYENNYELIYPTEYEPSQYHREILPTAFEPRNVGNSYILKWDADDSEESLQYDFTKFDGFVDYADSKNRRHGSPNGIFMPKFECLTCTPTYLGPGDCHVLPNPLLLDGAGGAIWYECRLISPPSAKNVLAHHHQLNAKVLRVSSEKFLPLDDQMKYDAAQYHQWIAAGDAEIIHHCSGIIDTKKRQSIRSGTTIFYATEFGSAHVDELETKWEKSNQKIENSKEPAAQCETGLAEAFVPTSFEPRNTGLTIKVEPAKSSSGNIQFHYSIEHTTHIGQRPQLSLPHQGTWMPSITMPDFTNTHVAAFTSVAVGEWCVAAIAPAITRLEPHEHLHHDLYLIQIKALP